MLDIALQKTEGLYLLWFVPLLHHGGFCYNFHQNVILFHVQWDSWAF